MSPIRPRVQGTGGAKILGGILLGGGVVAALTFMKDSTSALMIFGAGLALVSVAWVAYAFLIARKDRQQASAMSRSIAASASATPGEIANPAKRARLDDLRKSFEKGLEKFRAADKDVYSVPWYLVVGEPGSGKTEAIRHCKIGFPPGLQDPLQGAGGTVNMHWWFTNHGVFLDTAGRLMFEEVEAGTTSEWQEFMRLLVKARPSCPINGMLLFIPADALIKDTSDALEAKGARIAQQLDQIQRELGVRFPVYVIVSKCDLVNGFREFFDDIHDPKLQDQIVGWSSDEPLDQSFRPEKVDEYIRQVQERLARRRSGVLMDPVHTEDPKLRRADQVDALYAFPDSLGKLSTRLRRYLEMVFVAGAWSAKPLFLRGIYFTSSMREGSALDQELAEALGVSIEKLPEGRVWEKDRSFFLRDVFLEKAFPEQGLVSRAANVSKQLKAWRHAVLGLMAGGAVAVGAFTWMGYRSLDSAIVAPARFWNDARDAFITKGEKPVRDEVYFQPVVEKSEQSGGGYEYRGGAASAPEALKGVADVPSEHATLGQFPKALKAQASREVKVPLVFRPIGAMLGDKSGDLLKAERLIAARTIFEGSWVRPLYGAARDRLDQDAGADRWSSKATGALAAILKLEAGAAMPSASERGSPELEALASYVLGENAPSAKTDAADAQQFGAWLYNRQGGQQNWPSAAMVPTSPELVDRAIETFSKAWNGGAAISAGEGIGNLPELRALVADLRAYDQSEREIIDLAGKSDDAGLLTGLFAKKLELLREQEKKIAPRLSVLSGKPLAEVYAAELRAFRDHASRHHDALLDALRMTKGAQPAPGEGPSGVLARAKGWASKLDESRTALATEPEVFVRERELAGVLDSRLLGGPDVLAMRARLEAYSIVNERLSRTLVTNEPSVGDVDTRLDEIEARHTRDGAALRDALGALGASAPEPTHAASSALAKVIDLAGMNERGLVLKSFFAAPRARGGVDDSVQSVAEATKEDLRRPALALAEWAGGGDGFDARYAPRAAQAVLADFVRAQRTLELEHGKAAVRDRDGLLRESTQATQAAAAYLKSFASYWGGLAAQIDVPATAYSHVRSALKGEGGAGITGALESLIARQEAAAKVLKNVVDGWEGLGQIADGAKLQQAISAGRSTLATVGPQMASALASWNTLSESGAEAQHLVAQSGSRLVQQFAAVPAGSGDGQGDVVRGYVSRLWCTALTSVADEPTQSPAMAAAIEVNSIGAKFPLFGPSSGGELSSAEFDALASALERFNREAQDNGEPSATGNACLDAATVRIIRAHRPTAQSREFVMRVADGLESLRPRSGEVLRCTVAPSDVAATRDRSAAAQSSVWQLFVDGQARGDRVDVAKERGSLGTFEVPSAGFAEVRLISKNNRVLARVPLGLGWEVLKKIEQSGRRDDSLGARRVFVVALAANIEGREWVVELNLEFSRPLPDGVWLPR